MMASCRGLVFRLPQKTERREKGNRKREQEERGKERKRIRIIMNLCLSIELLLRIRQNTQHCDAVMTSCRGLQVRANQRICFLPNANDFLLSAPPLPPAGTTLNA
jgi:hypothetical protein